MSTPEERTDTCYLLVGGSDGALNVTLRAAGGKVAALEIESKTGFGGMLWRVVAQMLIDAPLTTEALNERVAKMTRAGLIPEELELEPLVKTLVRLGNS